ncbi:MAG: PD40 domain-containing protein [Phaeodactylibacter sp.]|nr:PD40 domain-containing protein [Phaeodactylibacter sp.]MCB9050693.1 PD40 domain-containing protein [Lewinellaceae bacterium]
MARLPLLFSICWILAAAPALVQGQSFKAYVKAAEEALEKKDYNAALQHYAAALEFQPGNVDIQFQYAEIARRFYAFELAEQYFSKVVESKEGSRFPIANYRLGQVKKSQGKYDEASAYFQSYLAGAEVVEPYATLARKEIITCDWAKEQEKQPERIKIENLGRKVNTDYSEFAPYPLGDSLLYSSFRYEKQEDDYKPKRLVTKMLYQRGGSRGRPLGRGFNEDNLHTAHTAFSLDGSRFYFTRCDYINATEIRCAIFYRNKDKRGRWSTRAVKLPESINDPNYTSTQPSIGYDSVLQAEVLLFVSSRPGGPGGLDLWWARVEKEENAFSRPSLLEEINTEFDDITPFFHTPSQTLYFSSDGYPALGGFDVYKSYRGQAWAAPQNLGAPANSSYNDIYYVLDENGTSGYLSSNRPGSFYLDEANKACCNDIYRFEPIPEEPPVRDTVPVVGLTPLEPKQPPLEPGIPTRLEDFLPLALYFDNDEPDRRTRRTTTKKTYGETFETYLSRRPDYREAFAEPLEGERRDEANYAVDEFFEEEAQKGYDFLLRFSEILLQRLNSGDRVEIFLKGYTSPRAKSDYNLALSRRRISSVRNHFQTYEEGIFQPYLESGQLVISERPFGEAEAASTVSDALDDLRNSIYHPDAARERRVEIVEIRRQ